MLYLTVLDAQGGTQVKVAAGSGGYLVDGSVPAPALGIFELPGQSDAHGRPAL